MTNLSIIRKLLNQSTWRLFGLGIITYGVYFAYYVKKQSKEINAVVSTDDEISSGFLNSIFVMSYTSLALFIAYMFVDEDHPIAELSKWVDLIVLIMLTIWGFKARNRVNAYCEIHSQGDFWFHGFWTFLFTPLYFNYKVNCILQDNVEQAIPENEKIRH